MADEQLYKRTGECNQCGDCCSNLPWAMKPGHFRNWKLRDLKENIFPIMELVPFVETDEEDRHIKPKHQSKMVRLGTRKFHYIFAPDGLHKDLPPYRNPKTVSRECPFLLDADDDDKRGCGLIGTKAEHIWHDHCAELNHGVPRFKITKDLVDEWFKENPNCSFEYRIDE